jgi:hypothetical protein
MGTMILATVVAGVEAEHPHPPNRATD